MIPGPWRCSAEVACNLQRITTSPNCQGVCIRDDYTTLSPCRPKDCYMVLFWKATSPMEESFPRCRDELERNRVGQAVRHVKQLSLLLQGYSYPWGCIGRHSLTRTGEMEPGDGFSLMSVCRIFRANSSMDHRDGEGNPTDILIDILLDLLALLGKLLVNKCSLQHLMLTACPFSFLHLILG